MARRKKQRRRSAYGSLGSVAFGGGGSAELGEDVDPAAGLINLADLMLVFACGLMIALVAYWNIDISNVRELAEDTEMTEVTDLEDAADLMQMAGSGYAEVGTVYTDPETGKFYLLTEDAQKVESTKKQ
jgi:hypothetical protein